MNKQFTEVFRSPTMSRCHNKEQLLGAEIKTDSKSFYIMLIAYFDQYQYYKQESVCVCNAQWWPRAGPTLALCKRPVVRVRPPPTRTRLHCDFIMTSFTPATDLYYTLYSDRNRPYLSNL